MSPQLSTYESTPARRNAAGCARALLIGEDENQQRFGAIPIGVGPADLFAAVVVR